MLGPGLTSIQRLLKRASLCQLRPACGALLPPAGTLVVWMGWMATFASRRHI